MILFFRSFSKQRRLQKMLERFIFLDLKKMSITKVKVVAIVDFDLICFQT